jgi:hypothetical protein
MGYNLFLDDIRQPWQVGNYMLPVGLRAYYRKLNWVIVRNYQEFVKMIEEKGIPDKVSFDHDLAEVHYMGGKESFSYWPETGLDCMKWMIDYIMDHKLKPPRVFVHSMDPDGAKNIETLFDNFLKHYEWDNSKESGTPMDK